RNLLSIFKGGLQKVRRNIIAWAIILGLVCVPSLYSWFNLAASWDPYGRTDQIKIALASDDEGYDGDAFPVSVNLGDNLVADIAVNKQYDWVITDSEDAIEGTRAGKYYAAVVVPESFSSDIMSIFSTDVHHSELIYYSNEKENAIAPKIIGKEVGEIQQSVDNTVTESILQLALNTAKDLTSTDNEKSASNLMGNLNVTVGHVKDIIGAAQGTVGSLKESAASMEALLKTMEKFSESLNEITGGGKALSEDLGKRINELVTNADSNIAALNSMISDLETLPSDSVIDDIIAKLKTIKADLENIKENLKSIKSTSDSALNNADKVAANLSKTSASARSILKSLQKTLADTQPLLNDAYNKIDAMQKQVQEATEKGDITLLKKIFQQDTSQLSSFLVSPVEVNRIPVYHMQNNGAAVLPFYTSLSLWIGALILVALMKTSLEEGRRRELDELAAAEGRSKLLPHHEYLGRYIIFACMGLVQTLIVCFGDLFYLGLRCEHPAKFVFASLFTSLVFVLFVYTLTVSFGNIGKAIAVVLLVMQVAGSGGILAVEMTPALFQKIYPLLPFRYSMTAMREAIGGTYGNTYWISLAILCAYIAFALLLGLVLRKPLIRLNEAFHRKLEDTKLM
ncbi:MAG: YhgE/Pip domain-containing protein, partial [Clostridia bacterium]|nr:YhgE/Pip domain-containing protein [Clostridia bacterium]